MAKKNKKATIEGIKIRCSNSGKLVTVSVDKCSFSGDSNDCEMCGSHGDVKVDVDCKCGVSHEITLSSW